MPYTAPASRDEVVYVISGGWHTEIGLPRRPPSFAVSEFASERIGSWNEPRLMRQFLPSRHPLIDGGSARHWWVAVGQPDELRQTGLIRAVADEARPRQSLSTRPISYPQASKLSADIPIKEALRC